MHKNKFEMSHRQCKRTMKLSEEKRKHDVAVGENFLDRCSGCCGELPRRPLLDQNPHSPSCKCLALVVHSWVSFQMPPSAKRIYLTRVRFCRQRQLLSNNWEQNRPVPLSQFGTTLKGSQVYMGGFPGGPVVKILGTQIQSGELRFHMLCGAAKKESVHIVWWFHSDKIPTQVKLEY